MCGIAGIIDFKGAERRAGVAAEMSARLRRRGPDEHGAFTRGAACLAHRRLSVIDPEHGKQPMVAETDAGRIALVYNGELYNAADLRGELTARGQSFSERSDTEVLLVSYLEWGADCVSRLNGIFAFAVWDERTGTLFAARDRMGVKPFFYSETPGGEFIFASEIKALLAHPDMRPVVGPEGVAELLLIGPGRTPGQGVFRGIAELKPGRALELSPRGGLRVWRYWKLTAAPHSESWEETAEHTRALLEDAIRRQTVSDVPLCAFLSGGVDSSAIAALSGVRETFSVDYEGNGEHFTRTDFQPEADGKYIQIMADYLGVRHTNVILRQRDVADALFAATDARDLPGMADVDSSLLLFCRAVKERATVALSGECSDELFGGYPWFRDYARLAADEFPWARTTDYRESFAAPGALGGIDPREYIRERFRATADDTGALPGDPPEDALTKRMIRLNTDWFMQTLLDRKDRCSMYSALEVRVPFCDHRIAEYVYNVPAETRNRGGVEKALLREALRGVLPEAVLWRKKSPYPKTRHPAYAAMVSAMLRDILADPNAPIFDIVRREALEGLLAEDSATPWYGQLMNTPQTIAYFVQLDYWLRKYKVILAIPA
ncbi:MAG: asparagine synthase (glutamine-hydrolyzing) [Clostridiales bacterium]|nr:asparagine synthase (glutamine-hydrolyzing) [Clostridiales bacterium]